ncbi:restriction endonuclease [Streptomyces cellostaticus]|uniref:restriction endonuclease n=1 Tax=Streptomyces cellostaticus TaxID=67285 RepID=UPI0020265BE6|nr:restriction endonuclease [Streptomyces cellostaticus]
MTVPARPFRPADRDRRRFDLRTTAMFFGLLAIILCVLSFVARTAVDIVERRPFWACSLAMVSLAAALTCRSRWRRLSVARCARRATETLEAAAEKASDTLCAPAPAPVPAPAGPVPVEALVTPEPTAPAGTPGRGGVLGPETTCPGSEPNGLGGEEATVPLTGVVDHAELDPDAFEQAIADLCARDDCRQVEVVGGAGDLGADVTAVTPDGRRVVIQCKRYCDTNKVGSQDMQRFGGTCYTVHEADVAVVVTTSDFTAPALEYARQCGILCVNGAELSAWTDGTGPRPWDLAEPGV